LRARKTLPCAFFAISTTKRWLVYRLYKNYTRAAQPLWKLPCATSFPTRRFFSTRLAGMPPFHRGSSGFRGVRACPNGTFYTELRAGGFRLTLGTYDTPELATRAFDVAAWRF
jgi:hypothetical protein